MTRNFQLPGAHGNATEQLQPFCHEFQPSLSCVDSSINQTVRLPLQPSLSRFCNKFLENKPSNYAGGLDCMDRLGILGEVAAREKDRMLTTVGDP